MKTQVAAGAHPWIDDWNLLTQDPLAQSTYTAAPLANMGASRQNADKDAHAAYLNAIRWYVSGDTSYADCAVRILNAWAATVNQYPVGADTPGLIAIPIQNFALAGEVLRIYPGWQPSDFAAFKTMFANYCYPVVNDFLTNHNGSGPTHYWANWDACNIGALLAMGVLCDNQSWFDQGVTYYQSGIGAGAIGNAVVAQYPGNLYPGETIGQWQESGRDQSHSQLGLGLLGYACQTAWNQGVDLFSTSSNRFLSGAEYVAQYNLWHDVPFTQYINSDPIICAFVARNLRGRYGDRPVYELLYNHYTVLGGQYAPNVKAMAQLQRPEGGSSDHFGYGTLTFTQVASASPYPVLALPPPPTGLTATASVGAVWLSWTPPTGDLAAGYNVLRATASGGPYTTISSAGTGVKSVAALYTDTAVTNGTTYYYVVQSVNQSGTSGNSAEVSALPVGSMALASGWADADIGTVPTVGSATCSAINNNTFLISGSGSDISGTADALHYAYQSVSGDFTFVGRLGSETLSGSNADKIGLMMRESLSPGARNVALILYSTSEGKQQLQYRTNTSGSTSSIVGQNYVYAPQWFKLIRAGDTFTGSISIDGTNWITTGTTTVSMASTYYAGIAVCSRSSSGVLTSGVMDNVTSVGALPNPPVITSANSATTTVGNAFTYQITATASPTSYGATGLPAGLALDPSTGLISGSATLSGTYNATITATNGSGTSTATLTITVNPAVASNGTWNSTGVSPLTLNLTFTAGAPNIAYTAVSTTPPPASTAPVVGDAIRVNTTVGNFSNANAYFVVAVNAAAGTLQLGTAPGAAALAPSAAGTSVAPIYMRWSNAVNWTGNIIANGYGAVATIGNLPVNVRIALGGNWVLGTLNFTGGGGSDLDISGYDYATTAGGSITFATGTSTTPLFSITRNATFPVNMPGVSGSGARYIRVIGNQGLEVMSSSDATTGTQVSWRPQTGIDWSQFSGDIQVRQGRLDVQANNVLPGNSNIVLGNGSTAAGRYAVFSLFSGRSQTIGALSGTAIGRVTAGTSSTTTAGTALTITLGGNNGSGTFAGIIGADAAGSSLNTTPITIVKNGTGTEIFSGANVYTGTTTINAGTFLLNGSLVAPVAVNAGTFGGSGSTSSTVTIGTGVGAGAKLAPGNGGIGTFTTTGALTLRSDATLALEFSPSLGTADKVVANGVTLNNAIFSPSIVGPTGALSDGAVFTIVDNTSASAVAGTFNGLPEGSIVTVGLNSCRISYVGGTGNDITLTVLGSAQPSIISSTGASGVFGSAFSYTITATNAPTSFSATGLPAGLTLNATTGVISGTPAAAGSTTIALAATNGAGTGTATLALTIAKAPATLTLGALAAIYDGSAKLATATTSPAGLAVTFTYNGSATAPTSAGSYAVVATIADANYTGTASATLVIGKATPTVTWPAPAAIIYGTALGATQLTATASTAGAFAYTPAAGTVLNAGASQGLSVVFTPTDPANYNTASAATTIAVSKAPATIAFANTTQTYDGTAKSVTVTTTPAGLTTTLTYDGSVTAPTAAGSYALAAAIVDANYAASASDTLTITPATQTITFNPVPGVTYGDAPFTVSATSSSGLEVSFSIVSGSATISGNTVTITGAGPVVVRASQAGNPNVSAAPAVDQSFTVGKANQAIAFNPIAGVTYGDVPFAVGATSNSGLAVAFSIVSGPATISDSTITITGAGPVVVRATQAGDANYNPAPNVDQTFTVGKANQAITFGALADSAYGAAPFTVSATSSSGLPVTFSIANGPATVAGNTVTLTGAGTVILRAAQTGDANTNAAPNVDRTFTVAKAALTAAAQNATRVFGAANPSLAIAYSGFVNSDTAAGLDTAPAATTLATTASDVGTYPITVAGGVSSNYAFAYVSGALTITPAAQTITFEALSSRTFGDAPFGVSATSSSGLPVAFSVVSGPATIAGSTVMLTGAGPVTLRASQSGSTNYAAAPTVDQTFTVAPASATVTLGNLSQTYNGTAKSATATTAPAGLTVVLTYAGSATAPIAAGSYAVAATITDPNYTGTATGTLVIAKATPTVTWPAPAAITYGTALGASQLNATASTAGTFAYTPAAGTILNAGAGQPLTVAFTPTDATNFATASVATTITVNKATAPIVLGSLAQTYDGTPKSVIATTTPSGLPVVITYAGSATAPTAAGSYAVAATINSANYTGSATGTLVISKAAATLALASLKQAYDGTAKTVTTTTTPTGLPVNVTYDGLATAPIYPGPHAVVAMINDPNYTATVSDTLVITVTALVRHAPTLDGIVDGSVQVLTAESLTLNSTAALSGDLLVPGTPTLQLNGRPTLVGTKDGPGSATPANYTVTLNSNAVVRYLVRHVDAITLPTVTAPPAGSQNVTLNGNAGVSTLAPGNYGSLVANGGSGFVLGLAGATTPAVYNVQNLTLNGNATLQLAGPVVLTLANGTTLSGTIGDAAHPEWLTINVAAGGVTLNGGATLHGTLVAPTGTVTLNGNAALHGQVSSDRLTLSGNALLDDPAP